MFVLCAAISECNNKQHSPLHVELPLEKWLEIAAAVILTGAIVSCSQKRVFVQQQTIAPITIRTCTRPSGVGRAFRAPQCSALWLTEKTMTTPILILVLLMSPLAVAYVISKAKGSDLDVTKYACLGLGIAFIFFSVGHFVETDGMVEMLPDWVPFRLPIIYFTGLV